MPDLNYDRPGKDRQYVSIQKHHYTSTNARASKWKSREKEKDTFDSADYGNHDKREGTPSWQDDSYNLWGFLRNFTVLGKNGEQFGFFPKPTNTIDRWHGFPVIPFTKGRNISENLIQLWLDNNFVDNNDIPNLIGGKKL